MKDLDTEFGMIESRDPESMRNCICLGLFNEIGCCQERARGCACLKIVGFNNIEYDRQHRDLD